MVDKPPFDCLPNCCTENVKTVVLLIQEVLTVVPRVNERFHFAVQRLLEERLLLLLALEPPFHIPV